MLKKKTELKPYKESDYVTIQEFFFIHPEGMFVFSSDFKARKLISRHIKNSETRGRDETPT